MNRRELLGLGTFTALQWMMLAQRRVWATPTSPSGLSPAGDLLDLAPGFRYKVIQRAGQAMSDGNMVPIQPDGMACFSTGGPPGSWVLLRNQELGEPGYLDRHGFRTSWVMEGRLVPSPMYRTDRFGGVSRVVLDPQVLLGELESKDPDTVSGAVQSSNMALGGTDRNCAGGRFPGGWVSCEESDEAGHGWAFWVQADDATLKLPRKIESWGRFKREGVALDASTGIVYMSEDHPESCLYRHVPVDPGKPRGAGTVQAMVVAGTSDTTTGCRQGQKWQVSWVDVPDRRAVSMPCRAQVVLKGATRFCRTEGIDWGDDDLWFICTTGGPVGAGQVFRYTPHTHTLTLAAQVTDRSVLSMPDNGVVTPWGDFLMTEDNYDAEGGCSGQYIRILTRKGTIVDVARNRHHQMESGGRPGAEFTGPCFSEDGKVLFVNLQSPENLTVAIRGPWETLRA